MINKLEREDSNKSANYGEGDLEFPYVHFATRGITADSLYPIV